MNCPKCGNTLNEEAVFCPKCGEKVIVTEGIKNAASVKKDDTATSWKWIIATLFFAVGIFFVYNCVLYLGMIIHGFSFVYHYPQFAVAFWFMINALAIGIGNKKIMLSAFIISGIVLLLYFFTNINVYSSFLFNLKYQISYIDIEILYFTGRYRYINIPFGVLVSILFSVKVLNTKLPAAVLCIVSIIWTMTLSLLPLFNPDKLAMPWIIGLSLVFLVSTVALLMLAIGLDKQKI